MFAFHWTLPPGVFSLNFQTSRPLVFARLIGNPVNWTFLISVRQSGGSSMRYALWGQASEIWVFWPYCSQRKVSSSAVSNERENGFLTFVFLNFSIFFLSIFFVRIIVTCQKAHSALLEFNIALNKNKSIINSDNKWFLDRGKNYMELTENKNDHKKNSN